MVGCQKDHKAITPGHRLDLEVLGQGLHVQRQGLKLVSKEYLRTMTIINTTSHATVHSISKIYLGAAVDFLHDHSQLTT